MKHSPLFLGVGDLNIWEFSGNPAYYCSYDYFATNDPTALHLVLFSIEEPYEMQLNQVTFWLNFLKALTPVEDPIGKIQSTHYLLSRHICRLFEFTEVRGTGSGTQMSRQPTLQPLIGSPSFRSVQCVKAIRSE